ncbi:MAG: type VI secretion system-associated protein TagF [Planctomycetota bacterium]|nr:type VI secretion system-associated protein TagF [Planctomycetota bacterium]
MSSAATIGCIGKLPLFGDFVRLNGEVSPGLAVLDRWMQQGIEHGYMQEGRPFEAKLRSFEPLHVACWSAGGSGWSGLLMPSADQVGRVYPILAGWQHAEPVASHLMPLVGRDERRALRAFVEKAQAERPSLDGFLAELAATPLTHAAGDLSATLDDFLRSVSFEALCQGWVDGANPLRRGRALHDLFQLRHAPAPPRYLTVIPYAGDSQEVGFWLQLIQASMPAPLHPTLVAWPAEEGASGSIRILFDRFDARYLGQVLWPERHQQETLDLHAPSHGRRVPADYAAFAAAIPLVGSLHQLLTTVHQHFR